MSTPTQPPAPTPGKRGGRKPGQKPRAWDYTGIDVNLLADPHGVTAELASKAAPMRARDERQVAVDQVVTALHREWVGAGKPDRWAQMPKKSYHVNPKGADALRMLVRRAASFLGVSAKFGKPVRDMEGREIVVFAIRDMRVKKTAQSDIWTLEEIREFAIEFFGDDEDAASDFLSGLLNEGEDNEENSDEEVSSESSDLA
jgi:hypothetical protein